MTSSTGEGPVVLRGGLVLTMDDGHRILPGHDVLVVDGRIAEIGTGLAVPEGNAIPPSSRSARCSSCITSLVVAFLPARALSSPDLPERVMRSLSPQCVLLSHWDNFFLIDAISGS